MLLRMSLVAVALAGCVTSGAPMPVNWRYVDTPETRRIELYFRNETGKAICLSASYWPDSDGNLDTVVEGGFLLVGQERFALKNYNTAYCPEGCQLRVASGEEVREFLPYEYYDLPERLWGEPKTLEFRPQAYPCRPE